MIILSIDGGGVRGIIPVMILEKIQELTNKEPYEMFDLFTGTSTGALICAGCTISTYGYSATYTLKDLKEIFLTRTREIFPKRNWLDKLKSYFRPEYSTEGIENVLMEVCGGISFSQIAKPCIIPTYELITNKPMFFKSRYMENVMWYDVLMSAIAAPTYFPPHVFDYKDKLVRCVDGGIYVNNPSLSPIFELIKHYGEYGLDKYDPSEIFMLSISTGRVGRSRGKETEKWGKKDWIRPAIQISMNGSIENSEYGTQEMLPEGNYLRVEIDLDEEHAEMSDASPENLDHLQDLVKEYFKSQEFKKLLKWIENVKKTKRNRNCGYTKFYRG